MRGERIPLDAVIVTHGRPRMLARCLASLAAAQCPAVHLTIHVGINGADDAAAGVIKAFGNDTGFARVRVHELERVSPAAARNRVLEACQGDWVFFIDDDAYVDAGHLADFARTAALWPKAAVIGGPNLTPPESSRFQRAVGAALSSRLATYLSSARYRSRGETRPCGETELILCNLFVRRQALGEAPFPADFVCAEENWMLQGLAASGHELVHVPGLGVWHERRGGWSELALQIFRYGQGRGKNLKQRPGTLRLAHVLPSLCVLVGLAALGALGAVPFSSWCATIGWVFALYAALCAIAAFRAARALFLPTLALFPVIHVAYGLGVLVGAFTKGLPRSDHTEYPSDQKSSRPMPNPS